jgi:hypothetical protein
MSTNYEDDTTQLVGVNQQNSVPQAEVSDVKESGSGWKNAVMTAGAGVFVGVVAGTLMSMNTPEGDPTATADGDNGNLTHPEWTDGEVQVASGVNDDMSFSEAFAAARQEVGPGGVFEWHGQIYGTYYADEWNNMSAAERAEYGSHFSWNHIDNSESDVASATEHSSVEHTAVDPVHVEHAAVDQVPAGDDDIEVVHVDHADSTGETVPGGVDVAQVDPPVAGDETCVEVLGVYHDSSDNTNVAHVTIDGHDAVMVDVDGDMVFDALAADMNDDGQLSDNEVVDIHNADISVDHLGGFTDDSSLMADGGDGMDVTDGAYEG